MRYVTGAVGRWGLGPVPSTGDPTFFNHTLLYKTQRFREQGYDVQ